jgi:CHAT domain-containing protein
MSIAEMYDRVAHAGDDATWKRMLDEYGPTVFKSFDLMTGLAAHAIAREKSEPDIAARVLRWLDEVGERHGQSKLQTLLMSVESDAEIRALIRSHANEATPRLGASAVGESRRLLNQPHPMAAAIADRVLRRGELIAEFLGDKRLEADALFLRSKIDVKRGDLDRAIARCVEAAKIYGSLGEAFKEAQAIGQSGSLLLARERYDEAERVLMRSLDLLRDIPDADALLAPTFEELAMIAARARRYGEASHHFDQAAVHRRTLSQSELEAKALRGSVVFAITAGENGDRLLENAERAVDAMLDVPKDKLDEGVANFAAMIALNAVEPALRLLDTAVARHAAVMRLSPDPGRDRRWAALALRVRPWAEDAEAIARIDVVAAADAAQREDVGATLRHSKTALDAAKAGNIAVHLSAALLYAEAAIKSGKARSALAVIDDVQKRVGAVGNEVVLRSLSKLRASALESLKSEEPGTALALRDVEGAIPAALDLLKRARVLGYAGGEARAFASLGVACGIMSQIVGSDLPTPRKGKLLEAIVEECPEVAPADSAAALSRRLLQRAIEGFRKIGEHRELARALSALSNLEPEVDLRLAMLQAAHAEYRRLGGSPSSEAVILANMGKAYRQRGDNEAAEACLTHSLVLSDRCGSFEWAYDTALDLSELISAKGGVAESVKMLRRAIGYVELVRFSLPTKDAAQIAFVRGKGEAYERLVRLYALQGRIVTAFDTLQQMKARALLSAYSGDGGKGAVSSDAEAERLREREAALLGRIRSAEQDPAAQGKLDLLAELDGVYAELAAIDPRYVARRFGRPLDFEAIRGVLARQERAVLLIDFFVHEDGLAAFLVRPDWDGPIHVDLPSNAADLGTLRAEFERQVVRYRGRGPQSWRSRAGALLEPLGAHLRDGDLLYLVPHRQLHGLPLHAFPLGGEALCTGHEVMYLPAASLLPLAESRRATPDRLTSACCVGIDFVEEARAVAQLFDDAVLLTGPVTGDAIDEATRGHDVIHISAHGTFLPDMPERSGLVIGGWSGGAQPGPEAILSSERIASMRFDAEIVCLSACVSGLARLSQGDEQLGIQRSCFVAGASSIISTLWPVEPRTTEAFMLAFYGELLASYRRTGRIDKPAAFRGAQQAIRGRPGGSEEYFWAAFTLSGDWK